MLKPDDSFVLDEHEIRLKVRTCCAQHKHLIIQGAKFNLRVVADCLVMTLSNQVFCSDNKTKTVEFAVVSPTDWWEHLKLTLQTRWPAIFGWLRPRLVLEVKKQTVEAYTMFPDLPVELSRQAVFKWVDPS